MERHLQTNMDVWVDNNNTTNKEMRSLVGVEPITTGIRSGRQRWYGHVMRKSDEDCVNKCMKFRGEGRRSVGRSVGRPRRTWLESVEADMTELEIDKEDVHDRKKLRRNVMRRKSNHIGKKHYKPIIIDHARSQPSLIHIATKYIDMNVL